MSTTTSGDTALRRHLHILIDEETYQQLRTVAFQQQTSIGDIVRLALAAYQVVPSADAGTDGDRPREEVNDDARSQ